MNIVHISNKNVIYLVGLVDGPGLVSALSGRSTPMAPRRFVAGPGIPCWNMKDRSKLSTRLASTSTRSFSSSGSGSALLSSGSGSDIPGTCDTCVHSQIYVKPSVQQIEHSNRQTDAKYKISVPNCLKWTSNLSYITRHLCTPPSWIAAVKGCHPAFHIFLFTICWNLTKKLWSFLPWTSPQM